MKKWILIRSNEDGHPNRFLDDSELAELLDDPMGTWGIERLLTWAEVQQLGDDANYWPERTALLAHFNPVSPDHVAAWRPP